MIFTREGKENEGHRQANKITPSVTLVTYGQQLTYLTLLPQSLIPSMNVVEGSYEPWDEWRHWKEESARLNFMWQSISSLGDSCPLR